MTVQLYQGDCLEVMRTLEPQSIDAIITDLPYGTTACSWDEVIPFAPMWEQVKRVLKPRGVFVTTAGQPFASRLVSSNYAYFRHDLVWDKLAATSPANSLIAPKRTHESILVFGQPGHTYNPIMWDAGRPHSKRGRHNRSFGVGREQIYDRDFSHKDHEHLRYPTSVVQVSNREAECNNTLREHPSQKPVALYAYLIRTYTNPGDTVGDFTMGSGTTMVACVQTGRNGIGCDNDPTYYAIAQKRIEQAAQQPSLFDAMSRYCHSAQAQRRAMTLFSLTELEVA